MLLGTFILTLLKWAFFAFVQLPDCPEDKENGVALHYIWILFS